jgi:hypothetical protein
MSNRIPKRPGAPKGNQNVLSLAVRSLESFQRRNQPTGIAHSRAIAELSRIVSRLNSGNNHA